MNARSISNLALLGCLLAARCASAQEEPRALFTMHVDGSGVRRVVYVESFPLLGAPRWSHDGARVVFAARGEQQGRALVVDTSGRNLIDLGAGAWPDWSPDDKQVVFEVPGDAKASVWVQNADGKGHSWLCSGTAPRWSPDGSQIAVGGPLRVLDVLTGRERAVFDDRDNVDETLGCDWSPDGKRLAAIVKRDDAYELVLAGANRQAQAPRLRLRAELRGAPAWSPDGRHLAVTILDPQRKLRRLYVLAVAGDDPPVLIPGQEGDNCDPAWSPDGKQLAFASTRPALDN